MEDAFLVLTKGSVFLKFGRTGAPHLREVFLSEAGFLYFTKVGDRAKRKAAKYFNLNPPNKIEVRKGRTTEVFNKNSKRLKNTPLSQCFSVVTTTWNEGKKKKNEVKTLDLVADNATVRDKWVDTLEIWVEKAEEKYCAKVGRPYVIKNQKAAEAIQAFVRAEEEKKKKAEEEEQKKIQEELDRIAAEKKRKQELNNLKLEKQVAQMQQQGYDPYADTGSGGGRGANGRGGDETVDVGDDEYIPPDEEYVPPDDEYMPPDDEYHDPNEGLEEVEEEHSVSMGDPEKAAPVIPPAAPPPGPKPPPRSKTLDNIEEIRKEPGRSMSVDTVQPKPHTTLHPTAASTFNPDEAVPEETVGEEDDEDDEEVEELITKMPIPPPKPPTSKPPSRASSRRNSLENGSSASPIPRTSETIPLSPSKLENKEDQEARLQKQAEEKKRKEEREAEDHKRRQEEELEEHERKEALKEAKGAESTQRACIECKEFLRPSWSRFCQECGAEQPLIAATKHAALAKLKSNALGKAAKKKEELDEDEQEGGEKKSAQKSGTKKKRKDIQLTIAAPQEDEDAKLRAELRDAEKKRAELGNKPWQLNHEQRKVLTDLELRIHTLKELFKKKAAEEQARIEKERKEREEQEKEKERKSKEALLKAKSEEERNLRSELHDMHGRGDRLKKRKANFPALFTKPEKHLLKRMKRRKLLNKIKLMELDIYRLNESRKEQQEQLTKETAERDTLREISPWMLSPDQQKRKEYLETECISAVKTLKVKKEEAEMKQERLIRMKESFGDVPTALEVEREITSVSEEERMYVELEEKRARLYQLRTKDYWLIEAEDKDLIKELSSDIQSLVKTLAKFAENWSKNCTKCDIVLPAPPKNKVCPKCQTPQKPLPPKKKAPAFSTALEGECSKCKNRLTSRNKFCVRCGLKNPIYSDQKTQGQRLKELEKERQQIREKETNQILKEQVEASKKSGFDVFKKADKNAQQQKFRSRFAVRGQSIIQVMPRSPRKQVAELKKPTNKREAIEALRLVLRVGAQAHILESVIEDARKYGGRYKDGGDIPIVKRALVKLDQLRALQSIADQMASVPIGPLSPPASRGGSPTSSRPSTPPLSPNKSVTVPPAIDELSESTLTLSPASPISPTSPSSSSSSSSGSSLLPPLSTRSASPSSPLPQMVTRMSSGSMSGGPPAGLKITVSPPRTSHRKGGGGDGNASDDSSDESEEEEEEEEEDGEEDPYTVLVVDNGSWSIKCGFTADQHPSIVIPSVMANRGDGIRMCGTELTETGIFVGADQVLPDIRYPAFGVKPNWEDLEEIWIYIMDKLGLDLVENEHPVLLTHPTFASTDIPKKMIEIMFEVFKMPACYLSPSPQLTAYAYGAPTALVVDVGHSGATVVPVVDGFIFENATRFAKHLGGASATKVVHDNFQEQGIQLSSVNYYSDVVINNMKQLAWTPESFDEYNICLERDDLRKPFSFVSRGETTQLELLEDLLDVGELCFTPQVILDDYDGSIKSLPELIVESLQKCSIDVRPQLMNDIVLSGAVTLLPGFDKRLKEELRELLPNAKTKVRVRADKNRDISAWNGGAFMVGLPDFNDRWYSKWEYDELGAAGILEGIQAPRKNDEVEEE